MVPAFVVAKERHHSRYSARVGKEMPTLTTKEAVLVSAKRSRHSHVVVWEEEEDEQKELALVVAKGCHHFAILSRSNLKQDAFFS